MAKKTISAEKEEKRRDHFTSVFCSDFFFPTTGDSAWHVVLQISDCNAAEEV